MGIKLRGSFFRKEKEEIFLETNFQLSLKNNLNTRLFKRPFFLLDCIIIYKYKFKDLFKVKKNVSFKKQSCSQ